ncbi:helix-turn-helix transcriptional regulator [Streptomyces luteireticuli]|uniref:HTH cro/C1-type domain-containing protein n=1 Tax=Streptomyces luteireticuli TaxID=173858 RepID=A0ABN0Z7X2_9ACTN
MGLADRRKSLGYSQEGLAHALGVDRTTIGRWEGGKSLIQPQLREKYAELLNIDLHALDALLTEAQCAPRGSTSDAHGDSCDAEDMIRREFFRALVVAGAAAALAPDEVEALAEGAQRKDATDFERMNAHLWQVYQLARAKGPVYPIVQAQLAALNESLLEGAVVEHKQMCNAAADLFQLAGELAFDANRYTDAAASYSLAASASKDAGSFDLWACSLVRHAYVDLHEQRFHKAVQMLEVAERIAKRGDSTLSTTYWVASVQAEAYAGLGNRKACERAMAKAEGVASLTDLSTNGGWLRFDGSRLAEERGARYVQLGDLDRAEEALQGALKQTDLATGQSFRRRGTVLADLAAIGVKRKDPGMVLSYGREAVKLAQRSSSGYVARRLLSLRSDLGPLARNGPVAELSNEIDALSKT